MKLIEITPNLMVEDVNQTIDFYEQELYERTHQQAELIQELTVTFYGMREFSIKDPNGDYLIFAEPAS
jgi:uncharacterized glyoxalase superfamily protein PhnB